MSCCDKIIHDYLISSGEAICPFCDIVMCDTTQPEPKPCCANKIVKIVDGFNTCINCGTVLYCHYVQDCYYKKPQKRLPYNIKYGVQDILNASNQFISLVDRATIVRVVKQASTQFKKVFPNEHRLINLNYLISKIISHHQMNIIMPVKKMSEKTLQKYQNIASCLNLN